MLDRLYISVYKYYSKRYGKRSITIAGIYINLVYASILWAISIFALVFAQQMNLQTMSNSKYFVLYILVVLGLSFKNWLYYNGKKRNILKSQLKGNSHPIVLLWLLPVALFLIGVLVFQLR